MTKANLLSIASFARLSLAIALVPLFILGTSGACTADPPAPAPKAPGLADMSLEDLMNVTVVTAGKKAEAASTTPAAVFVITHEDIDHFGYRTLAQALKRISGFYSEYDYLYDYIGLRGYLPNNDINRRVLVLIDGHRVNDYLYGQAPVDQDLPVDLSDLDRIEVVKGPGSALWGSEALLCVINCITKTAGQMPGFQLRQDLGLRDGQHLSFGQGTPGGLQVTASVSQLKSAGQQSVYFTEFNDPTTNNGIASGLDGERVDRGYVDMSYQGLKLTYSHVRRDKDVPTAFWNSVFNTPGPGIVDERHYWELSYESPKQYAGDGKLFCRVYRDNYDALCRFNWLDETDASSQIVDELGIDLCRAVGAEARYSRDLSDRSSVILGAEYLRTYKTHRINYDIDPYMLNMDRSGDYSLISYYAQANYDITPALRMVGGTRLDDHSLFGGSWSPRLALVYKQSPKSTLKLLYGKALRMPSISEAATSANPYDLFPEQITTSELVWDRQVGQNGHLITSVFGFNMHDMIRNTSHGPDNVDTITSKGIESQYEYRLGNGGSGYLGLSVVHAKKAGSHYALVSSPHCLVTSGISIPVLSDRAFLATELQYVSASGTNMHQIAPAYAVANLNLTSKSLVKNGEVSVGIANLFNTPHVVNARPEDYQDKIPQPDRAIQVQLSYNL